MSLTEPQQLWVDALRSGKYKQGSEWLVKDDEYCCLGVACAIAKEQGIIPVDFDFSHMRDLSHNEITNAVRKWMGLRAGFGAYEHKALASDNDNGRTFDEIANTIEREPVGLFVKP